MTDIAGILANLDAASQALQGFAQQTRDWRRLSERLFDIREGLQVAGLTLESWHCKYDVHERRPLLYMQVLFGKQGSERVHTTLGSIDTTVNALRDDINRAIGQALKVKSIRISPDHMYDSTYDVLIQDCLARIRQNKSWSHRFHLSVLRKLDDVETRLGRLEMKLTTLERWSDLCLEREHPDRFLNLKRLPGRRAVFKMGDSRGDVVQNRLLDALAARKDAELLHRASGENNTVHIGLSVPQIHKRDFAFLLNLEGKTHEVLVHPVKIKAINDPSRIQTDFATVIPILTKTIQTGCYMLPSTSTSAGFQVSIPPANILYDLEHKDALSTTIRNPTTLLCSPTLYAADQSAIASGIAQACFRLLGSPWLDFLDCTNIRWRRTKEGKWTSMLTASPGNPSTTRALESCLATNNKKHADLSKHTQIFRIGLVLAELALQSPISYITYDPGSNATKLFLSPSGEEITAVDIAAEVERKTNVFLANMVFFCLDALQDDDAMRDRNVEVGYLNGVLREAEMLDALVRLERKRRTPPLVGAVAGGGGGLDTPLSAVMSPRVREMFFQREREGGRMGE